MSNWRWVTEDGKAMTEWTDKPAPPVLMRAVKDEKGWMYVEFQDCPETQMPQVGKVFV